MSKAFTKEDGAGETPTVRPPPTLAPGEVRYITREGHDALSAQLAKLDEERAALRRDGALDAASRRAEVEGRLAAIEQTLAVVTVAAEAPPDRERVFFGAWVTLEDEEGERSEYRIVGPDEVDPREGRISVDSPLARQLLGRAEGDDVELRRPRGVTPVSIVQVRYEG